MRKKVIAGLLVGVAMVSLVLTGCGNKKEANILVQKILLLDINDHMGER